MSRAFCPRKREGTKLKTEEAFAFAWPLNEFPIPKASRGTPAALATGEWQLRFSIQA